MLLSFIVSFDQVTISIFLSTPDTSTLPVKLYNYVLFSLDPMVAAASSLMIVFAYMVVLVIERVLGLDKLFQK
jgi:putative spermidine/putrescine transport system permease protein